MNESGRNRPPFEGRIEQQSGHMVEVARAHEGKLRSPASRGQRSGYIPAKVGQHLLPAPQSDCTAAPLVDMVARACKRAGAHEVRLQLQSIVEMKEEKLHRATSEPRA
jgi:hypothetical protein